MQWTDAELVERVKVGDKLAFQGLARRHANRLFGLAYSLLGSTTDAEDVVQETMLAALNGMESFQGRSSVGTWLRSILVFQSSKIRRSRRTRRALSLHDVGSQHADSALHETKWTDSAALRRLDVRAMLDVLPDEYRQALVLRELQQMSYDEIAQALSIPLGTVESRLFRARQMIRRRFPAYVQ